MKDVSISKYRGENSLAGTREVSEIERLAQDYLVWEDTESNGWPMFFVISAIIAIIVSLMVVCL